MLHRRTPAHLRRDEQLVAVASVVARCAHGGATLLMALDSARSEAADPLASELAGVLGACERGATVDEALQQWTDRSTSGAVDLFVAAARLGHAEGGRLAVAMDGVAMALSDRSELLAESRSQSAQARLSVQVLVALPMVGLAAFSFIDPSVLGTLLGTPAGLVCLVVGVLLDLAGAVVSSRIVDRAVR